MTSRFVALLRGINVGGRNIISKDALRVCFEELGFDNVRTYIQSGNILFRSGQRSVKQLTTTIVSGLSSQFSYEAQAVVIPYQRYKAAVAAAPPDWGSSELFKHNALFTLSGITPKQVLSQLPAPKDDLETVATGPGVLFWSASKQQLTRTSMMKLPASPAYQQLTVRNHNTVFKLLTLLQEI